MNQELTADELAEYLNGCEDFKVAATFGKLEVLIQRLSDNAPPIVRICYKHQLAVSARQAVELQIDLSKATTYALGVEQLLETVLDRECPAPGELTDCASCGVAHGNAPSSE